jgi:hypothetical protein
MAYTHRRLDEEPFHKSIKPQKRTGSCGHAYVQAKIHETGEGNIKLLKKL